MTDCSQKPNSQATRQKDRQVTEDALIKAASKIFSAKGFEKATTKEIALAAGYSEALIHRYFESKDGLLLAVFRESKRTKDPTAACNKYPPAATVFDEIQQILTAAISHFKQNNEIIRIVVSRAIIDPTFQRLMATTVNRAERLALIEERLQIHVDAGRVACGTNLREAAEVIAAMSFHLGFTCLEGMNVPQAEINRTVSNYARVLADGISAR